MNLLLIQLKRIGDLILTTPAVAALREKFPDAKISLVVSRSCAELLPAIPKIDNFYLANEWLKIARQKFDCCIDFTRTDRSAFLTLASRAEKRITSGRKKFRTKLRALIYNEFIERPLKFTHTIDSNLALLEPLGIREAAPHLDLDLPDDARERANQVLAEHKIEKPFVVLHPGSARREKFWKDHRWAGVIRFCAREKNLVCVLTSGSGLPEQKHLADIKSKARAPFIDLSGKIDLLALAALLERARLLVSVDSAPVHLAAAMRTPQVILFGPTNPFHWAPRESPALILHCDAVLKPEELLPQRPRMPMKLVSTRDVFGAIEALLSAPAASPP